MLKHPAARGGPASKVLRPAFARLLTPVGEALARTPITPNALTIIGTIGMSAGALTLFPTGHLFAASSSARCLSSRTCSTGSWPGSKGTTGKFGAFLDSTMDRVADASVFGGLAAWFVLGGHDKLLAGGGPVLPGGRRPGVVRQGPGREPRPELRRRLRRTDRAVAYRASCHRAIWPWRTVCPSYRALVAGGGQPVHVWSAGLGRPPLSCRDCGR